MSTKGLLVLFVLAMGLLGCAAETAVPTRAAVAVIPPSLLERTPTPDTFQADMPPTWTPRSFDVQDGREGNFGLQGTLGPTPIASGTAFIPTNTPRPSATPTPSITPSPTWTPTPGASIWPVLPPSFDGGRSKLGIHIIRNNDANILNFIRDAQPTVIKALDDFGYLPQVKELSPNTIIVGRVDDIFAQNYVGEPEQAAREYVTKHLQTYQTTPWVDYWEGWNEPDPNLENMGWYARFEQERVVVMASYGLRSAIGGFAAGVPEMDEFELFVPAIERAIQYGGILTLHEYSAPDMTYLYGSALPGYPSYPDRGALTFRYRWYYREILEPRGLVIPLVITEAGIDGIIGNRPGPEGKGWKDFSDYWVQQGIGSSGRQAFVNQLAWYDTGVRQDGYVIGFTIFTAGGFGYWENYNINSILPDLASYVRSQ